MSTWDLQEFNGGIDLRDGAYTKNQTRFQQLENCWIDKGKKLRRRPPCVKVEGSIAITSQGYLSIDGQEYVIAKKGDTVAVTGQAGIETQILRFDPPDYTTTWTLLSAQVFNGYASVWIRHTFPSTAYPSVVMLHVWDGLLYAPTFVQDSYLPGSFSPSIDDLADQAYDAAFVPVLGQGATKLWTSSLAGNAYCCRTADARVWNQRTQDQILRDGEHWCYIVPEGIQLRTFIVPRNAAWMSGEGLWAYYVLEYNVGTAWVPMTEVSVAPTAGYTWRPITIATRFAGGWNEIGLELYWGSSSAGLIRLRLVAGATSIEVTNTVSVSSVNGVVGGQWALAVGDEKYRFRSGDGQTRLAHTTADLADNKTYLLAVTSDAVAFPELIDITSGFAVNGWEREHRRFIKKIVTTSTSSGNTLINPTWKTLVAGTGTVDFTIGTNTVVGTGTSFLAELKIGSTISVAGAERIVAGISDNTHLTVTVNWASGAVASAWSVVYGYAIYTASKTHVYVDAVLAALITVGSTLKINSQNYQVSAVAVQDITITSGGVDGDFTGNVNQYWNPIYRTNQPTITDYQYAYESDENSSWYTDVIVEYIDMAGAEDAVSISSASHDNTGGQITSISSAKNRMLITYAGSMQLWSIDQDTSRTAFLDSLSFGTGDQATPSPVNWYGGVVVPTVEGFRAISVVGSNTDSLQDLNIGEPISDLPMVALRSAAFWPKYGQLIIAGKRGSDLVFLCLDYSRESKITAWSQWIVAGMGDVDPGTLIADQGRLRWRSGTGLYYFDADATLFRDFGDTPGAAYLSTAFFHFNDMDKPNSSKRTLSMDIVQDGISQVDWALPPYGTDFEAENGSPLLIGAQVEGISYGRSRIPVVMVSQAFAPRITTRDETGWRLQRLSLDFIFLKR